VIHLANKSSSSSSSQPASVGIEDLMSGA